MSEWDIKGLEANFEGFKSDRYPSLSISDAFERFVIRQVLKDEDLSDDELESGILGGADDGGIDGMYFFVNRTLVHDESDLPDEAISAQLVIVQVKYAASFSETTIVKLEAFARDLLDHARVVDKMVHLNSDVRDAIRRFRENYSRILGSTHVMRVLFVYATKSDGEPNVKVLNRVDALKKYITDQVSHAQTAFDFWGCQRLLAAARRSPTTTETLEISKQFTADDGSAVCLVRLGSLAKLLRDEYGEIRRPMLEPNVRDYQGVSNSVNKAIRETLDTKNSSEFWWLNNGVTILASQCSVVGNKLRVERPEVVNGLQTSYEIFQHFKAQPDKDDNRTVLVRVIVPPDEQVRSRIIRATNSQTPISDVSLHATDPIHFDIEEKLRLYQIYYERRKGEYRELKKPANQIISIQTLARAVMAILLQQPNNAYATPSRVLKSNEGYNQIFSDANNRDIYVVCMLIQKQTDDYLSQFAAVKELKSIIRYYVAMAVSCHLLKTVSINHQDLARLLPVVLKSIDTRLLEECKILVLRAYEYSGGTETIAKGPEMKAKLLAWLATTFIGQEILI